MYTIDISNKHKRNYIAFVELYDEYTVVVVSDTLKKLNKFKKDNLYQIKNFWKYDKSGLTCTD